MKRLKEKFKSKKTQVTSLAILGILFITAGISYAFFTYSREGLEENTIESGAITFHYQEDSRSISLTNAMPISDEAGIAQENYFDFTITSKTSNTIKIPYYVTVKRKGNDSSLDTSVKLYLTEVNNNVETPLTLENDKQISKYSELATYVNDSLNITAAKNEKSLYRGIVPANSANYEKHYRLRMWLTDGLEFTQNITGSCSDPTYTTVEDCEAANKDWTDVATPVEKEFTATVNVYGFGNMASNNANINSIVVNNNELTAVSTNTYETDLTTAETSTTINVETENEDAQVSITKTQSDYSTPLVMNDSSIQRLSATKSQIVNLTPRDNYFRILITSEDTTNNKELHLKINAPFNLSSQIRLDNILITETPNFNTNEPSVISGTENYDYSKSGLYSMNVISGFGGQSTQGTTYYFRGAVNNNYVDFAGKTWRVVRINEDGTIRLTLNGLTDNTHHVFNSSSNSYSYMYYSNSQIKSEVESWYSTNITGTNATKVAIGNYFCEAAKVKPSSSAGSGNASMATLDNYVTNLECLTDGNSKGLINANVGLLTVEEVVMSGAIYYNFNTSDTNYYLYLDGINWWTMSPAGFAASNSYEWNSLNKNIGIGNAKYLNGAVKVNNPSNSANFNFGIRPVINLKTDVIATGTGTESDPYVVQ